MFRRFALALALASVVMLDSGCAILHKKAKPKAAASGTGPVPVGTISLVNAEGKFALIDNGVSPVPPVGGLLESFTGATKSGELVTTQVRRHPFTIADIRSGDPKKGDRVVLQPVAGGAKAAPPVQASASGGNPQ